MINYNLHQLEPPTQNDSKLWDIWMSQHYFPTLTVSIELGLFSLLNKEQALTVDEISQTLKITKRATSAIVAVLSALGLLTQSQGKFSLTETSRIYLLPESPFY
jgi:acetylserotonin N-methyltransferase